MGDLLDPRGRARELRRQTTEAERKLWWCLRDRTFKGRKFRRQHPVGPYFLDFYCPEARLAIELDGGQHAEDEQRLHDEKRSSFLSEQKIKVLRFWNRDVLLNPGGVLEAILNAIEELDGQSS
ncbi:MAG: DUF559 domain-containing protein [Thermoanaerobaculia bacterium]|nr:DUF559 domain-containing protein [Thermoanaerobaculia bacterium]